MPLVFNSIVLGLLDSVLAMVSFPSSATPGLHRAKSIYQRGLHHIAIFRPVVKGVLVERQI